jgi:hypothetical protein
MEDILLDIAKIVKNKLELEDNTTSVQFYKKAKITFKDGKIETIKIFPIKDFEIVPVRPIRTIDIMIQRYGWRSFAISRDKFGRVIRIGLVNDYVNITDNETQLMIYLNKIKNTLKVK